MEMIEDDILSGVYKTHDIILSTTQISKLLSVNPTTSVKAVSHLVDQDILYKKRGIGMCVKEGAREKILSHRREQLFQETLPELLEEVKKLGIPENEIIEFIQKENDISKKEEEDA